MIRGELRKAFGWQSNYKVLTRTDVDAMLKEHGFQQSGMVSEEQRKKVGEMTSAQYICVSTVTKEGTQLYIESYLVDIETGVMTNPATQFTNVSNNDYSTLQKPCNQLAKEMLGELDGNKKFSGVVGRKSTSSRYVDLGLPSGVLWKSQNEDCGLINYDQAYNLYNSSLPSVEQWEELRDNCIWTWMGNGYKIEGQKGETIFLPANGCAGCDNDDKIYRIGLTGWYWSSTPCTDLDLQCMIAPAISSDFIYISSNGSKRCQRNSIRLVK